MIYEPDVHDGTPLQRATGLMVEMGTFSAMMRIHAVTRETARIVAELRALGFEVYEGIEEDDGMLLLLALGREHEDARCTGDTCYCEPIVRFHRESQSIKVKGHAWVGAWNDLRDVVPAAVQGVTQA